MGRMTIRCLIVDDNARFAQDARELLEDEGISVLGVAVDGQDAVKLARELRPDLALVDIDLGEESGLSVAQRLCAGPDGSLAGAVILISTHAEEEFTELIEASPAIGFLAKSELSAGAIQVLLSHPSAGAGRVI